VPGVSPSATAACTRPGASACTCGSRRSAALRALPAARFDYAVRAREQGPARRLPALPGCFYCAPEALVHQHVTLKADRDRVWIRHGGAEAARYRPSYERGSSCSLCCRLGSTIRRRVNYSPRGR
jgi:hypothetical protein